MACSKCRLLHSLSTIAIANPQPHIGIVEWDLYWSSLQYSYHQTFMKLAPDILLMKCLLLISLVKMSAELPRLPGLMLFWWVYLIYCWLNQVKSIINNIRPNQECPSFGLARLCIYLFRAPKSGNLVDQMSGKFQMLNGKTDQGSFHWQIFNWKLKKSMEIPICCCPISAEVLSNHTWQGNYAAVAFTKIATLSQPRMNLRWKNFWMKFESWW